MGRCQVFGLRSREEARDGFIFLERTVFAAVATPAFAKVAIPIILPMHLRELDV